MKILRTPDESFANLPDWPYAPNYVDNLPGYENMRMHYIDEGPKDAEHVFLCIHGEPTWSYLFRRMIPVFLASGARVIAPDMFGFGRSDKPVDDDAYTYHFHRDSLLAFLKHIDTTNITLVCQDWGGILGLTLPMEMPDRFSRLIVMNTALPVGQSPGKGFEAWRDFVANNPEFNVGGLMQRSTPHLSEAEVAAYSAPFPNSSYLGGVRRFPALVMTSPEMEGVETSKKAIDFWQNKWQGQSFMAIGMQDPVLGPPAMQYLHALITGCPPPMEIADAGHFVQEWGEQVAEAALAQFQSS